jgi:hypothetical protein
MLVALFALTEVLGGYSLSDDEVDWQAKFNKRASAEMLKPLVFVVDRFIGFFVC